MSLIKSYLHNQMNTFTPNPNLEMLMQREQLMEDIESIIESKYGHTADDAEDLIVMLCDAVCKNFPAQ